MEFRQLRYFITVAEELHFGRAAEQLQITQPALSKQIARLETALDVQLLFRTKRTVKLTHAGQIFLEQAHQLLAQRETAIQLTKRTGKGEIGELKIGYTQTAVHTVLPNFLRDFLQRYPKVEITFQELSTEAQVAALNQNKIDLAFLHPPIDQRGINLNPILEERFFAVLPPQHPLLRYDTIPVAAFANEPFIIHPRQEGPMLHDAFVQVCQAAGFTPNVIKESISLQTRVCWVAAGVGITFVSECLLFLVGTHVVCRPIGGVPIRLQFAAAWRQQADNPTLQNALQFLPSEMHL